MWQPGSPFANVFLSALLAALPIAWMIVSPMKLKMTACKASLTAFVLTLLLALLAWKMPPLYSAQAAEEGALLGLWQIVWVIFAAIFAYNLMTASGAMDVIKKMLIHVSDDRRVQTLIIAFAFGGFLEAIAGFGTSVAIPASILVTLGFEPMFAAILCLVANTVPVALGVVGVPALTLAKVTELPIQQLTAYIAYQLFPLAVFLPVLLVALTTRRLKGIRGVLGHALAGGIAFAAGQTAVALLVGPELAAIAGSLAALGAILLWNRLFPVKKSWHFPEDTGEAVPSAEKVTLREGLLAWCPYLLILIFILATDLLPFFKFLGSAPFQFQYLFYQGPKGTPLSFSLVKNPGTLVFLGAVLGGAIQRISLKKMLQVAGSTLRQMVKTLITVLSIVAIAKLMGYSGMTDSIAACLSVLSGSFFPLIAPLIGALGTFITGSDTSSNVLFGLMQKQTALQLGENAAWIAAANASGATVGKMVSLQSISIASTATSLKGADGKILSVTMKYAVLFAVLLGIIVYVGGFLL